MSSWKPKVVSRKNLPVRPPLVTTAVILLVLDRLSAPGWVWGAILAPWGIIAIIMTILVFTQEEKELWSDDK